MNIVYFGYLVEPLKAAIDSGVSVKGVVIEPSSKKTKDMIGYCEAKGLNIIDAGKIRSNSLIVELLCDASIAVVGAFGQIFPGKLLRVPKYGFCNIHFSYLPKYKGNNPMEWMIINGEEVGGVTYHWMSENIDEGDIIKQCKVPILSDDNYNTLYNKCLKVSYLLGKDLFSKGLGDWPRKEQDIIDNGYYHKRTSKDSMLSKNMSLLEIDRIIRAEGWKGIVSFSCKKKQFTVESHLLSNEVSGYQNGEVMQVSGNKVTLCFHGRVVDFFLLENDLVPEVNTVID